jgi:hypothetical protein
MRLKSSVTIMYIAAAITMLQVYGAYGEPTWKINVLTMVPNIRGGKCHVATPNRNRILSQ